MIDTIEKRRMALDFGKIRGTGMPVPSGHIDVSARAHILNLYYETAIPTAVYFWRNKNRLSGTWKSKETPTSTWRGKKSSSATWRGRTPPPDNSTQEI